MSPVFLSGLLFYAFLAYCFYRILSRVGYPPWAALLVFVDVMKEMPITLMMRPFGWNTLATRVFELTNEGEWRRAALPALSIVAVGLVPVLMLTRRARDAA
jgi:ABC-type Fe3+ transport system permease subunit